MKYTLLGKSDLKPSKIGFGCMSLPTDYKESDSLISKAIEHGINYFDTADLYEKGENEKRLGKILKDKRKDVILATKVGNRWKPDGSGWEWNPSKEYIIKATEQSLIRLQTDYIDLIQLHGGTSEDPISEIIEAFEQLKREGKVRNYGISSIRPNVIREYTSASSIVSVMMQYSLLDLRPEEEIIQILNQNQIGIITRGSLAQGLLTGKEPKEYLAHSASDVSKAADAINMLCENERNGAHVALLFTVQNPSISLAVVGIRTNKQLDDAITIYKVPMLSSEEINTLRLSVKSLVYTDHR